MGGSQGSLWRVQQDQLVDLRTNQERGKRDIRKAREVKEHSSKAGDLGESQRWKKLEGQRKRSYAKVLGRSRHQGETPRKDSDMEVERGEINRVDRDQV